MMTKEALLDKKEILNDIALGIKKYINRSDYSKFRPPSPHAIYGKCGYAAKIAVKEIGRSFEENVIVYYFPKSFHIVAVLGNGFMEGWKIDPTIGQFRYVRNKHKLIFGPHEEYPLLVTKDNHPKINIENPIQIYDDYFTSQDLKD